MNLDAAIHRMLYVLDPPDDVAHEVEVALRLGACRQRKSRVPDVARRLGWSRRWLSRRMRERGMPPPGTLLRWGRILDIMLAWSTNGMTLQDVAFLRGYGQGADLSNLLHRHAGIWPTEWSGDIGELCEALKRSWAAAGDAP